jgi:hypothetical protein
MGLGRSLSLLTFPMNLGTLLLYARYLSPYRSSNQGSSVYGASRFKITPMKPITHTIHELVNTIYPMMFRLSPMYCGFRVYLYGPPVTNPSSIPITFFNPKVTKAHEPINDPSTKILIAYGSLCFKENNPKLSKSSNPISRKFTKTKPTINQEKKNCQDRAFGGGQKRKPGNFMVSTNRTTYTTSRSTVTTNRFWVISLIASFYAA